MGATRLIAVLALLLAGCGLLDEDDRASRQSGAPLPPSNAQLASSVLSRDSAFGGLSDLKVVGRHLVVTDAYSEPALHLVRRADGTLEGSFGPRGEGPGEFEHAGRLVRDRSRPSRFWVFDSELRRLTPGAVVRGDSIALDRSGIVDLRTDVTLYAARPMTDSLLVGLGFFTEGRYGLFDRSGEIVGTRGSVPPGEDHVPARVRQHAHQCFIAVHPRRPTLVLANRHAGRIEIHRMDRPGFRLADTPEPFPPRYEMASGERGPVMATGGGLRFGYVDVAATDRLVYGLYSGRERAEAKRAHFGNELHVFAWDGTLLRTLSLDGEHPAIALGPGGRRLYALAWDPVPSVVAYDLSAEAESG